MSDDSFSFNPNVKDDENEEEEEFSFDEEAFYQEQDGLTRVKKGEIFEIKKADPTLREFMIGLGWEVRNFEGERVDMDASVFVLGRDGKTRVDSDFIFYNNRTGCDGAVRHSGDSRTGAGDGDDETIFVDLNGLPYEVDKISVVVSIYRGKELAHDFSQVRDLFMRIANVDTDYELCRIELDGQIDDLKSTGLVICEIIRDGPYWNMNATVETFKGGLGAIATAYGIIVQE